MDGFCNSKKSIVRLVLTIIISTVLLLSAVVIPVSFAAWTADLDTDYAINGVGIGHWTVASQSYTITVEPCANGSVTVSATEAEAGTEITVTATPNSGYICSSLTYSYSEETENIMPTGGQFKFTMPAANVTVNATFIRPASSDVNVKYGAIIVRNGVKIPFAGTEGSDQVSNVEISGIMDGDEIYIYFDGLKLPVGVNGVPPGYSLEKDNSKNCLVFKATHGKTYKLTFTIAGAGTAINGITVTEMA